MVPYCMSMSEWPILLFIYYQRTSESQCRSKNVYLPLQHLTLIYNPPAALNTVYGISKNITTHTQ